MGPRVNDFGVSLPKGVTETIHHHTHERAAAEPRVFPACLTFYKTCARGSALTSVFNE